MTAVFYEQEKLWGNAPEPYQVQLRADILSILPPDARSILDVGCGDGFVTNALPGELRVVGLDISAEALRHVRRPAMLGSAVGLPFADGSFELVMATDVIEHIPSGAYERCLAEMARVSSRYVLLAVPHGEQLEANLARCADCGRVYHINLHQRSFDEAAMRGLALPGLRLVELRFSGADTRPPWDALAEPGHGFGQYHVWRGGQCPDCGSGAQHSMAQGLMQRVLDSCRGSLWAQRLREGPAWNNRSELLALYERRDSDAGHLAELGDPKPETRDPIQCSPLDIRFSNALQARSAGFVGGSRWSGFIYSEGAAITEAGISRQAKSGDYAVVQIRIPAAPRPGDRIIVRASGAGEGDFLSLVAIDGISERRWELSAGAVNAARQAVESPVDPEWRPGRCGLAMEAILRGGVVLHELEYVSDAAPRSAFVHMEAGHQVLALPRGDDYARSWGFLAEAQGLCPAPDCPVVEDRPAEMAEQDLLRLVTSRVDEAAALLVREQAEARGRLEAKERERDTAEKACARAQCGLIELEGRLTRLNDLLEAKESQRAAAEEAYAKAEAANAKAAYAEAQCRLAELAAMKQQLLAIEAERAKTDEHRQRLESSLAQTEANRETAETAYARQCEELARMQEELRQRSGIKGAMRELLRSAKRRLVGPRLERLREVYPRPWRPLTEAPAASSRTPKVLVLSHMFPHPDQPSLGPFVLEQVRALREHAGVDARVLSGRPFWMAGMRRSPVLFLRQNFQYWDFHRSCQWLELEGVPVMYLPYRVMLGFWFHGWSYSDALCHDIRAVYRQFPFELVHAHTGYMDGSAGAAIARQFKVPLVITEHTGPFSNLMADRRVRRRTLRSLEHARRVIAVSNAQKADVAPHLSPQARERMLVVHNGVDLREFHPPERWTPSRKSPRLLFVGGLDEVKNVSLLLRAFAQVLKEVPEASLTVIGTGSQSSELEKEAGQLQLGQHVHFAGRVDRAGVAEAMRDRCDLLVLCSRSETFGCVLIEAMACGKPVVSTRCGGPEDIVTEAMLGCLCCNHDVDDLARAILEAVARIDAFVPQRIRGHVEQRFGYPAIARRIAEVYQEVLCP
jgi:glycosyltransferase involved in cell wall biosynthesis/SAM-dependent methyltransferase